MKRCLNGAKKHRKVIARWGLQEKMGPCCPKSEDLLQFAGPPKIAEFAKITVVRTP